MHIKVVRVFGLCPVVLSSRTLVGLWLKGQQKRGSWSFSQTVKWRGWAEVW